MIFLWIILWILGGLLGLLLILLVVPLGASARGAALDLDLDGEFRVWWGFGMIQIRGGGGEAPHLRVAWLRLKTLGGKTDDDDETEDPKKEKKKKGSSPGVRWFLHHRRTLLRAVMRLLGSFRLEGSVRGSFGTGDPAETATAWAVLQMVDGRIPRLQLDVRPRYVDEGWDLEGEVHFGVWPIRTVFAALGLFLRRDVRKAMKTART